MTTAKTTNNKRDEERERDRERQNDYKCKTIERALSCMDIILG